MGSQEGEPALPVYIRNIANDPGVGGMTPAAVIPDSLLVQVCMAQVALCWRLGKDQGGMALTAFDLCMLSHKGHIGSVVVIGIDLHVQFPAFGTVALVAGDLEILPVRGIGLPCRMRKQEQQGG